MRDQRQSGFVEQREQGAVGRQGDAFEHPQIADAHLDVERVAHHGQHVHVEQEFGVRGVGVGEVEDKDDDWDDVEQSAVAPAARFGGDVRVAV